MVNMIGFHHKEPTYNTATPGQEGFYINVKPRPTDEYPQRARVSTPTAWATFNSPDHARVWADHPGSFPLMVTEYLKWASA